MFKSFPVFFLKRMINKQVYFSHDQKVFQKDYFAPAFCPGRGSGA
jgi:ABC-type ATPase with predicted acetyltransferase domain